MVQKSEEQIKLEVGAEYDRDARLPLWLTLQKHVLAMLKDNMKQECRKKSVPVMQEWELYGFVSLMLYSDMINLPLDKCVDILEVSAPCGCIAVAA